jgi:transcriptional regulator with XRE-family HTH domain
VSRREKKVTVVTGAPLALGDLVRQARHRKGWSMTDLARESGGTVSRPYLSQLENGHIAQPGEEILATLARLLDLDAAALHGHPARTQRDIEYLVSRLADLEAHLLDDVAQPLQRLIDAVGALTPEEHQQGPTLAGPPHAASLTLAAGSSFIVAGGELITFKVLGETYTLFEYATQPGYVGPPPHRHLRQDQSFYVLESAFVFHLDGQEITAGAGASVHIPRGTLHTFRNSGNGIGRLLGAVGPSGDFEAFVQAVGEPTTTRVPPIPAGPPSAEIVERILTGGRLHYIEIPSPGGAH